MNWEAIGAIGQAVSALALVMVIMQLRHARDEMQRTVRRARVDSSRDLFVATATHPELASALQRLTVSSGGPQWSFVSYAEDLGLMEAEARQVNSFQHALWRNFEASITWIRER